MKLNEYDYSKNLDYLYLYKRMWPYVKPYLLKGLIAMALGIPVGLMEGAKGYLLKPLTDYLNTAIQTKNTDILIYAPLIPVALVLYSSFQGSVAYFNNYLTTWTGLRITMDLKKDLYNKLLTLQSSFYDKNTSGIVMVRFLGDAEMASGGILNYARELITVLTTSLSLVVVLITLSWKLSIVGVLFIGFIVIPINYMKKVINYVSHETMKVSSLLNSNFYETFNGNRIISSFNLQGYQFGKFKEQINTTFDLTMKQTKRQGWLSPIINLITSCGLGLVIWYGIHMLFSEQITVGTIVAFVASLLFLYRPIKNIGNIFTGMHGSFIGMNRVVDLFDIQPSIKNKPDAVKLDTIKDEIRFEDVYFEYEENAPVLKGVSFDIKIGESLALVGNSGGGKTTIANLIPRFYDVKSGSIKVDGYDVRDIELQSLRQNIAIVFQDNFLFSGTIKDNILLGKFDASEEEINMALERAYLDEFVAALPDGVDTQIGERGVKLSGGQKQRLAIARAMVKNAPVVILDEATSALDNKSEAIVQKAMEKLMENRTVIVIAHRLSTVQNATNIAVIEHGNLIELGPHEELIKNENGAYHSLYMAQFRKNEESAQEAEKSLHGV